MQWLNVDRDQLCIHQFCKADRPAQNLLTGAIELKASQNPLSRTTLLLHKIIINPIRNLTERQFP